jgi:hypothetical protein
MHVKVGDAVDLTDLEGKPLDASTLAIGGERLMDAITALLADLRHETPPITRMVYRRKPE